jgi:hypothetical protein
MEIYEDVIHENVGRDRKRLVAHGDDPIGRRDLPTGCKFLGRRQIARISLGRALATHVAISSFSVSVNRLSLAKRPIWNQHAMGA